jgi:hypothetical protein
LDPLDQ